MTTGSVSVVTSPSNGPPYCFTPRAEYHHLELIACLERETLVRFLDLRCKLGDVHEYRNLDEMDSRRLAIPIYLNQRIVFDLLAIMEGGFSQFRTIRTFESGGETSERSVAGGIGISNVFALLGIGVNASRSRKTLIDRQREESEERVVTPASIFSTLRDYLLEDRLLQQIDSVEAAERLDPGAFVEFSATLHKNSFVGALEALAQGFELVETSSGQVSAPQEESSPRQRGQNKNQRLPAKTQQTGTQIRAILEMLTQANTVDLIAQLPFSGYQAVVPVENEYFSARTPVSIIDGEFVVLGKIVRHVRLGSADSIDLLRGTSLGLLPSETIDEMATKFGDLPAKGFRFPTVIPRIPAPCIQVVPIAIYA